MNRIQLVWSCIWNVLSEFFVSVGLSENLSIAIFVMDSLRQLAMKFLEREELVNYNFQNEFLKPIVVIMQKSNSSEICELIVRCVSQMVLSCVNHVKSGWKSVFMVFTTAVADDRSLHCLLAVYTWKKCTLRNRFEQTDRETDNRVDILWESVTDNGLIRCLFLCFFIAIRLHEVLSRKGLRFRLCLR
ncbi:hypothetical protein ZIOFF_031324 [Zingiber officinale]|uniref:Mon2/Sec7/BIG1-like HDS domain-containing protein n=1 Tax=Zingiber officinale TaxID=94328 RepID=A0A8J5GCZ8_ZINOF|nr:hypothetical protein ZIOFF_031324 [Zingiber officinale]